MRAPLLAAALTLVACSPAPEHDAPGPSRHIHFVEGSRYNKGAYDHEGKTVVTFQIAVSNRGPHAGRPSDVECHTVVGVEHFELEVVDVPELAPRERGWLRVRGEVPRMGDAGVDDLEAYCSL